jgi:hypothetical protein
LTVPDKIEEPPIVYPGFIDQRIPNPIKPLAPYNPIPEMFVFLEGPAAPDAGTVPNAAVPFVVTDSSFAPIVLPVINGSTIEMTNLGRETVTVSCTESPDLVGKDPFTPGTPRRFVVKGPVAPLHITVAGSVHAAARVVPVPNRYFARAGAKGAFELTDVPVGDWKVKIWYRDGWLVKDYPLTVKARQEKMAIPLPEKLETTAPAAPAAAPAAPAPAPAAPAPAGK